jgi:hypothetical protein
MADFIDREKLKQNIRIMPRTTHPELVLYSLVQKIISNEPSADVVEVVRCKDCKHLIAEKMLCTHIRNRIFNTGFTTFSNHFCSYGEKKECEGK